MTTYVMMLLAGTFSYIKNEHFKNEHFISNLVELATTIVKNTNKLSTISLLVVFFGFVFYAFLCHKKPSNEGYSALLTRLLIGSFTASTIPTGISLILCALIDIKLLKDMTEGLGVYIAYAGLSLISMTILLIFEEKKRIEKLSKKDNHKN
jgi:hypothetical protein